MIEKSGILFYSKSSPTANSPYAADPVLPKLFPVNPTASAMPAPSSANSCNPGNNSNRGGVQSGVLDSVAAWVVAVAVDCAPAWTEAVALDSVAAWVVALDS